MSSGLNKFQEELYTHLIEYKWYVMGITEPGTYKGRQYDYMIPKSYAKDDSNCRYTAVGYNYWDLTARFQSTYKCLDSDTQCPFLKGRNQLWRNQLLALALVETGSYAHAHFSVVHHRDNHSLNASMAEYRQMISPETPFSSFTNEDILRAAERHSEGLQKWIGWYEKMYRM